MDFKICTLSMGIHYEDITLPFENPKVPMHQLWQLVENFWNHLCFTRDQSGHFTQHRMKISSSTISSLNAHYADKWFRPSNAISFVKMMLEWCDEYIPTDIGCKALKEIFFTFHIAASAVLSLASSTSTRASTKASPLHPSTARLFGYDFLNARDYFSDRYTHRILESVYAFAFKGHVYEYKGCMRKCIDEYYAFQKHSSTEVPIVCLNAYVAKAFFYEHIKTKELTASDSVAIPALYLTITALQKYHYGDFDDPLTDITYFWCAMSSIADSDITTLKESLANLRSACNDLQHGAMAFRSSLA